MRVLVPSLAFAIGMGVACGDQVVGPPDDCSVEGQNDYLHTWMLDQYLWYDEMPEIDPLEFDDPKQLIRELRSGEDRWSFVTNLAKADEYFESGGTVAMGIVYTRASDDRLTLKQVLRNTPAEQAGLRRGDQILSIGGKTLLELDEADAWDAAWGENEAGVRVELGTIPVDAVSNTPVPVWVEKQDITVTTVPYVETFEGAGIGGGTVGYLMFTTFIEPSFAELDAAFEELRDAGVTDLVVDLRYNGGGLLSVAQHLASLIAPAEAVGERMYTAENNDRHSEDNWWREFVERDAALGAERVVFITSGSTLSASELVINVLRPYMDVMTVGDTTGGKPFGMKFLDYCDIRIAPVTFRMVNALGDGHYAAGIAPDCVASDQLNRQLGEATEDSLATAMELLATGSCPAEIPTPDVVAPVAARSTGADADFLQQLYAVH